MERKGGEKGGRGPEGEGCREVAADGEQDCGFIYPSRNRGSLRWSDASLSKFKRTALWEAAQLESDIRATPASCTSEAPT